MVKDREVTILSTGRIQIKCPYEKCSFKGSSEPPSLDDLINYYTDHLAINHGDYGFASRRTKQQSNFLSALKSAQRTYKDAESLK